MGIDHRRVDILMPQEFLDSANIVASFEQVRGKRMPEGVAARRLGDPCLPYGRFHGTLQHELTHVMPPFNTAARVDRTCCHREDILPSPLTIGIQILSLQGIWPVDAPESFLQVPGMQFLTSCRWRCGGTLTFRGSTVTQSLSPLLSLTTT